MKSDFAQKGMLPTLHIQVDNAADNKNRWVVGFAEWIVKNRWVEEVTFTMMEVGHTHEDIDAVFRRVAVPDATVHPIMTFTQDWKTYLNTDISDTIANINNARELIIRKREKDGGTDEFMRVLAWRSSSLFCIDTVLAFWYKPDSSHKTLYPTAKDKNGKPMEVTVNGERAYKHCEYGIEIFRTGCDT
eukprot:3592489-Pleurochrysis_carterae.AAC.1